MMLWLMVYVSLSKATLDFEFIIALYTVKQYLSYAYVYWRLDMIFEG